MRTKLPGVILYTKQDNCNELIFSFPWTYDLQLHSLTIGVKCKYILNDTFLKHLLTLRHFETYAIAVYIQVINSNLVE